MIYFFIYVKHLEKANLQRLEVDSWLFWAEQRDEESEVTVKGPSFLGG